MRTENCIVKMRYLNFGKMFLCQMTLLNVLARRCTTLIVLRRKNYSYQDCLKDIQWMCVCLCVFTVSFIGLLCLISYSVSTTQTEAGQLPPNAN